MGDFVRSFQRTERRNENACDAQKNIFHECDVSLHKQELVAVEQHAAERGEAVLLDVGGEGGFLFGGGFAEEDSAGGFFGSGELFAKFGAEM